MVTVADRRAEELISAGLRRLRPGSVVVGEEAVADDPALLRHLRDGGDVWLVDPVDGTANFAAGRRPFALMVALLTDGEPAASLGPRPAGRHAGRRPGRRRAPGWTAGRCGPAPARRRRSARCAAPR